MARTAVLALLLCLLPGCGKDPGKELAKARSWSATAMLVAEHWLRGEVPLAYARESLRKAAGELAQGPFPDAAAPVGDLELAVAREDRPLAGRILDSLR
jgi:hypothetical protein